VWVGNSRGHEELESVVPRDRLVTELQRAGLVNLLQEDGLEGGVELFTHVFNENPLSELDTELEVPQEGGIGHLDDFQA
jgi:hypothetical protein